MSKFVKRALAKSDKAKAGARCVDVKLLEELPALAEFLTLEVDDGKPRQTATLNVSYSFGRFTVFLNDRQTAQSFCLSSETLAGALEAIDAALQTGEPPWRDMGQRGANQNGQQKKVDKRAHGR